MGILTQTFGSALASALEKLGKGLPLGPWELDAIRNMGGEVGRVAQTVGGWIGTTGRPDLGEFRGTYGHLTVLPNRPFRVSRYDAQSIPNNVQTQLQFDYNDEYLRAEGEYHWDASDPTKLFTDIAGVSSPLAIYVYAGLVTFASDPDGDRWIVQGRYDVDDTLIGGNTLACVRPAASHATSIPFAWISHLEATCAYTTLEVGHTAGAALNIEYATFALARLR